MFSPFHRLPFPFVDCFLCYREALWFNVFFKFFYSMFLFAFVAYAFSVVFFFSSSLLYCWIVFLCLDVSNLYFFFFLLYNIVLVLPYINMHLPRVYTCLPSWTSLPPPSPYHPSGSSQCTSPKLPVSCIKPGLAIHFLYDIQKVITKTHVKEIFPCFLLGVLWFWRGKVKLLHNLLLLLLL